jgi:hypothetical protein
MFIRSQAYGSKGRITVVDSAHVAAWEISDAGVLFATLTSGECIRMGRFGSQEEALKWLGRVPVKIAGGAFVMQVPDLEEERE